MCLPAIGTFKLLLKTGSRDIRIINSFFPTDNGLLQINENELEEIFAAIEKIIENNVFSSCVLWVISTQVL